MAHKVCFLLGFFCFFLNSFPLKCDLLRVISNIATESSSLSRTGAKILWHWLKLWRQRTRNPAEYSAWAYFSRGQNELCTPAFLSSLVGYCLVSLTSFLAWSFFVCCASSVMNELVWMTPVLSSICSSILLLLLYPSIHPDGWMGREPARGFFLLKGRFLPITGEVSSY